MFVPLFILYDKFCIPIQRILFHKSFTILLYKSPICFQSSLNCLNFGVVFIICRLTPKGVFVDTWHFLLVLPLLLWQMIWTCFDFMLTNRYFRSTSSNQLTQVSLNLQPLTFELYFVCVMFPLFFFSSIGKQKTTNVMTFQHFGY